LFAFQEKKITKIGIAALVAAVLSMSFMACSGSTSGSSDAQ